MLRLAWPLLFCVLAGDSPVERDEFEHGFVDSDGVKLHYAALGRGPLVVMLHGFPDYWYTWRHQMRALATDHRVVAIDMRGYNRSDAPRGVDHYAMARLVGDVAAVIEHFDRERATIVGHDWGGAVAWNFAMARPERTERLIVCNLPHPRGLRRELSKNREQRESSRYARDFQQPDAHERLTAEGLAGWVDDAEAKPKYVAAFERSSFEGMLSYYKRNYPRAGAGDTPAPPVVKVACPVLMIHGLDDQVLLAACLNDTWEWLEQDLTLVTIPGAGHFVQHDARDLVTRSMAMWLRR